MQDEDNLNFSGIKKFFKKKGRKENTFLIITAILLVVFQVLTYIKGCLNFYPLKQNMILLYLFLLLTIPMKLVKNKQIKVLLYTIYIAYFFISLGFFLEAMFNPNLNCQNMVFISLKEATVK